MAEIFEQGGPILYVLLALNILGLALVLTKIFVFWGYRQQVDEKARELVSELDLIAGGKLSWEYIKDMIASRVFSLEKGLSFIRVIASISPLLGLLGTVWGIFISFRVISQTGFDAPDMLAGGISSALVTTVAGLIVAIPHVIAYQFLIGQLDHIEKRLEQAVSDLYFKRQK